MVKYSFIIPIYNCEEHITDIVNNIIAIHRNDIEIVLINDGSTDNSRVLIYKLETSYSNILCYNQSNCGVSTARNQGLKIANGDYVIFVDADDTIDNQEMENLLTYIDNHSQVDLAIFGMSFDYYYNGKKYRSDVINPKLSGEWTKEEWGKKLYSLYDTNSLSPIWNKVIRKNILINNSVEFRKDMFLYEDLDFSLRCMSFCNIIYFCDKAIYHYRQSEDEGNAGRRLQRIKYISSIINIIDSSLSTLLCQFDEDNTNFAREYILTRLFLVLIREKNNVSNYFCIKNTCEDFQEWINQQGFGIPKQYCKQADMILNRRIISILFSQTYSKIRHFFAIRVKYAKAIQLKK